VQVDLILQGLPDLPWVRSASELLYGYLLRAGVLVYVYGERPLHAKVAVIEDLWATVGSSNLDPTRLGLKLEANVVVLDAVFAGQLRERLKHLMQQHSERVPVPAPGPLRSAWIGLRSLVTFHAMRRLAAWVRLFPSSALRVVPLRGDSA